MLELEGRGWKVEVGIKSISFAPCSLLFVAFNSCGQAAHKLVASCLQTAIVTHSAVVDVLILSTKPRLMHRLHTKCTRYYPQTISIFNRFISKLSLLSTEPTIRATNLKKIKTILLIDSYHPSPITRLNYKEA